MKKLIGAAMLALVAGLAHAQDTQVALDRIDRDAAKNAETAKAIWTLAEVGYQETQSSALLQKQLRDAGFRIEAGVAGIPTAFTATWGSGGPVIAVLGEFDALPGINQSDAPTRDPVPGKAAGHACGHHLFGVASASAA
ncbi:MAG: amidohydrolase, partial [Sphingomonadaceae bacterium]|nr:amidohydrolase [Sphingomonadaceae bacterium]